MSHLTEEQFEDILLGGTGHGEHVDRCPVCQARLDAKRSLMRRVREAFSSIHPRPDLAGRIKAQIAAQRPADATHARPRIVPVRARRRVWSAVALAATVLLIVILRSSPVDTLSPTQAAQMALVGIHRINLDSLEQLVAQQDLGAPSASRTGESGRGMAMGSPTQNTALGSPMPCCRRGLCLCGRQEREFQGRLVECCIIRKPNAPAVSVIRVPESPQALGMVLARRTTAAGQPVWQARCGPCNLASIRLGDKSYYVIGEVPHEDLVAVLNAFEE